MSETGYLSKDDLRRKRLLAFGQQNLGDIPSTPPKRVTDNVIDLCESSGEIKPPAKVRRASNGSSSSDEDERLHSVARRLQARKEQVSSGNRKNKGHVGSPSLLSRKTNGAVASLRAAALPDTFLVSSEPYSFSVATYNLWFGPQGNGEPHARARMQAVHDCIMSSVFPPPLFVGFQEVIDELAMILFPLLEASGYTVVRQPDMTYGVAVAILQRGSYAPSIRSSTFTPFQHSIMGRGFWRVFVTLPNQTPCVFCTSHLESFQRGAGIGGGDYTGAREREMQLKEIHSFCAKQYGSSTLCLIAGDLNWDDARKKPLDHPMIEILPDWTDAWIQSQSAKEPGYTYDGKRNPMLNNNLRRRFDRILVKGSSCRVATTQLIGCDPLPKLTFEKFNPYSRTTRACPVASSDHFGLIATLSF